MKIVKNPWELEAGKWYAIGVEDELDNIQWSSAPLLKFVGDDTWVDESNEIVEFVWDAVIQDDIKVSDADAFALQS
jgi:hypothetical protein